MKLPILPNRSLPLTLVKPPALGSEYSPYKSLHHVEHLNAGVPVFAQWDLTNKCNHRCKTCYSYYGENFEFVDEWPLEEALRLCDELKELGVLSVELTGGGDPTVYRGIDVILNRLHELEFDVGMVTNGVLLHRMEMENLRKLTWLRISIDAFKHKTYEHLRQRPWQLDKSLELIPTIKERGCIVGSSFVTQRENIQEINEFAVWSRNREFDNVHFSINWEPGGFQFTDEEKHEIRQRFAEVSVLSDDAFTVFAFDGRLEQRLEQKRNYDHCYHSDLVFIISASGELYRCSALKNTDKGSMGSALDRPLKELWSNRGAQDVHNCPVCWRDKQNEFTTYLMSEEPKHVNFI